MSEKSQAELRTDVEAARRELAATLDAIEDKLNVPRKLRDGTQRLRDRVGGLARNNPIALVGIVVGVAAAIGGVVWAIVAASNRD